MLGCVAAVMETESPSQLSPAVIQRTWSSLRRSRVDLPYGWRVAIVPLLSDQCDASDVVNASRER